jgi:hypothetical protein
MMFAVALSLEIVKSIDDVTKSFHVVAKCVKDIFVFKANAGFCKKRVAYNSVVKLLLKIKVLTWSAYLD